MKNYSMGIDIGTTSTKAVLFDDKGAPFAQSTIDYPLDTSEPKTAVQDPEELFEAVIQAVSNTMHQSGIRQDALRVMAFSSAMHGLIAVDQEGQALTPLITWADQRSERHAEKLKLENGQSLYEKTGTPIHSMSPLAKLLWFKEEDAEIFSQTHKFIGIKEYVFYRLFKRYLVDYSVASATGLFNIYKLQWDEEALETAGVSEAVLSEAVPTTYTLREMNGTYAEQMAISPRTPVVIGATDGCLANLGVDAISKGTVALSIGTSGAIRTVVNEPVTDPKGRIFCYALTEQHWVIGGPVNNGGMILRWLRDELCQDDVQEAEKTGEDVYNLMTEKMNAVKAGSKGLLFHPYLAGERAPSWNSSARGSFYGLAMHHTKEDMMRSVLEGITMNLKQVMDALEGIIGQPEKIHGTGGFVHSNVWRQMIADVFNLEVHISQTAEGACLGAAFLGQYAIGDVENLSDIKNYVASGTINKPNMKHVEVYQELLPIYNRVSRLMAGEYDAITQFQQKHS